MTPPHERRSGLSPGPSWTVLSEPASSSPSTHAGLDVDMGNDESEHASDHTSPIIPKRKALADTSPTTCRPNKVPRLDLDGDASTIRGTSSASRPTRTHALSPSTQNFFTTSDRVRTPSTPSSGSSDFPGALSQMVHKGNMRDRVRERETAREQGAASSRQGPSMPVRKQTAPGRKVTTSNLVRTARNSTRDESSPWTRLRPKHKPKRTNYNEEMSGTRPLEVVRNRAGGTIKLTDSSDSRRRRSRPSQPTAAASMDDPIIILSSSDDDRTAIRPAERRQSEPSGGKNRTLAPPPANAEVISILDSDEELDVRGPASTSQTNPPPPLRAPAAPRTAPAPTTTPATVPPSISPSASTRILEQPPSRPQNTQQNDELHDRSSSFASPQDDLDDANLKSTLNSWGNFNIGSSSSSVTLPNLTPFRPAVVATSAPEREVDVDELFDSYVNMNQMEGEDQRTNVAAPSGVEDRTVASSLGPTTSHTAGNEDRPNHDTNADGDMHTESLEEGELDPNDAPPQSAFFQDPDTPESGEIYNQDVSPSKESQPPPSIVSLASIALSSSTVSRPAAAVPAWLSSSVSASPRLSSPGASVLRPVERTNGLVMPDISGYKGMRFKRPKDARDNPFFSRALVARRKERKRSGSGGMSMPVDVPSSSEVQQGANTDMQADTSVSMPAPSSSSHEAHVSPSRQLERQAPVTPATPNTSTRTPIPATTMASNTTTTDAPLTQPTPSSVPAMPSQPPAATQPPVRSSSRPVIAPPRIPCPKMPMTLAEAFNNVRSAHLEMSKQERELLRKQHTPRVSLDEGARRVNDGKDASVERETAITVQTQSPWTPAPTPAKLVERPPSLSDLRTLLSKWHGGTASPSSRPSIAAVAPPTPTTAPTTKAKDGPTIQTPILPTTVLAPVALPVSEPQPVPTSVKDRPAPKTPALPVAAPTSTPTSAMPAPPRTPTSTTQVKERSATHTPALLVAAPTSMPAPTKSVAPASTIKLTDRPMHYVPTLPVATPLSSPMPVNPAKGRPTTHTSTLPVAAAPASMPAPETRVVAPASTIKPKDRPTPHTPTMPVTSASTSSPAPVAPVVPVAMKPKDRPMSYTPTSSTSKPTDRPIPHTPTSSTSKPTNRPIPHTPALPVTAPMSTNNKPKDRPTPHEPTPPVPMPTPVPISMHATKDRPTPSAPVSAPTTVVKARPLSSPPLDVTGSTPTPTTVSTSSSSGSSSRRPTVLPLAAFISPVHPRPGTTSSSSVGPGTRRRVDSDPLVSPISRRSRGKPRKPRESDAAMFKLRIVRQQQQPPAGPVVRCALSSMSSPEVMSGSEGSYAMEVTKVSRQTREEDRKDSGGGTVQVERPDAREVDETDTLLELASVHLSQPDEMSVPEDDAMDESPAPVETQRLGEPERGPMVIDAPEMQEDIIDISSHATTPELVLPEDDTEAIIAADQEYEQNLTGQPSGGGGSIEKCDAPVRDESEGSEGIALIGQGTASNSSLDHPAVRWSSSKEVSSSRATSSVDPLDLLRRSAAASPHPANEYTQGYRVVTWESWVAEQRARRPAYKLARQLPHSLQDFMNGCSISFRASETARQIFEAHIQEAMANEPDAPLIEIFDNDNGDEVTPQWEFYYTNEIWYGEGVPPPDVANLESCGCVGRCDPKSETCACARRQLDWVKTYMDNDIIPSRWPGSPFVYDHKGVLQRLECPIFECNRFCHCDEDCSNRVVQNGRRYPVHIVRTKHKGWGVSAGNKRIPKGSYIGIYAGELLTEREGEERGRYYDIFGRTYLFSVDFHHLKLGLEHEDDWDNLYVVDAYHAGNFTRFLNHSCDPNCKILACYIDDADVTKPLLVVFTTRDVEPWEELCFSYYGDMDEKREEIEATHKTGGEVCVRDRAVYAQCRCDAENCIGRFFG